MRYRIIFLTALSCLATMAKAQKDQRVDVLQNVFPPSPNAASLGKYVDVPVRLFTGQPDISIPLYELKGRSLSVPISLSYQASGIKVTEQASCVGLGWTLQAGGVITRSMRGLPDELDGAGYNYVKTKYNNPADLSSGTIVPSDDSLFQRKILDNEMEAEPDLWMINALGKSYKFYFSPTGTIITQPYSNLKISVNFPTNTWTVLMEDGTRMIFGTTGFTETTAISTSSSFTNYISSWYLKSVTSTANESINFTYTNASSVSLDSYLFQTDFKHDNTIYNDPNVVPSTTKAGSSRTQTQTLNMLTLSSIESDLLRVDFDTVGRNDLVGSKAISAVKIYSKYSAGYLKRYQFNYNYSTATTSNVYPYGYASTLLRLKLASVEEIPADNQPHKFWTCTYNPLSLPSRKSYAQDHWGYYNGAVNNTTLLPVLAQFNPDNYATARRTPDSVSMQAEILTKIAYPTGGYTEFNYEPNGYPANEEQFTATTSTNHLYLTYNQSPFTNTQTTTFTQTRSQWFNYSFTGVFSSSYMANYGAATILATASLKNSSGTVLATIGLNKGNNNATLTSARLYLAPGTYSIVISSISNAGDFTSAADNVDLTATYKYEASLGYSIVNHRVGGLRLKSLFSYDNIDTSKNVKKYYQYENAIVVSPLDTTADYLASTLDNLYDCDLTMTNCGLPCLATSVQFFARNSSTRSALGSVQGGTVGYAKVTEKWGANAENGKTVYYYTNDGDVNVSSAKVIPFPAIISLDYERGLLLRKEVYDKNNVLLSKLLNTYQYDSRGVIKTFKAAWKFNVLSSCYVYSYISQISNRIFYEDKTYQLKSMTSSEVTYSQVTGDSLVNTRTFTYENNNSLLPTKTLTYNSKGDSIRLYSRTPLDKVAINASLTLTSEASKAIDSMVARNIIEIPVQTEFYVNTNVKEKTLTNFKVQPTGLVLPDNVLVQTGSGPVENRVSFARYNAKGNIMEQMKTFDQKKNYLWNYQYTYPVAEITNADSSQVAYTSFEADYGGNWTYSGSTTTLTAAPYAPTGKKYYNLTASATITKTVTSGTVYYVSYWSKNGAYTISGGSGSSATGKTINGWTYYQHTITASATTLTVTGTGAIDELRLYPTTARMETYTYEPGVGITAQCDQNNRITYYSYDGYQRLTLVQDQDLNVIKKICYSFNGLPGPCEGTFYYYSVAKSGSFTRNNCGAGYTGSTVNYTVPAGTYTSIVSQADADQLAQNDVSANGQNYANSNGTCTTANVTITASNFVGVTGFNAVYTNTSTSTTYTFSIPAGGGNIGSVPAGTYNLTISKSGNSTSYIFGSGCSYKTGTSATFNGISIASGSGCKTPSIDSVN